MSGHPRTRLFRRDGGGYRFVDAGRHFWVLRGGRLAGVGLAGPHRRRRERWYIVAVGTQGDPGQRLAGNPDGYRTLRAVREHIDAVRADRAAGLDARWLADDPPQARAARRPAPVTLAQALARRRP